MFTKDILTKHSTERTPLYNSEALTKIRSNSDTVIPQTILGSSIPRKLLYTPLDVRDLDYKHDLGSSGEPPFTRGIHTSMYRGRLFTIRQLSGAGSPAHINHRLKMMLSRGATGINLILDLPSIQMFDSDEPESLGQVGTVGVPIDCVEDMENIYKDIPIDKISSSIVTHYPQNTAILFPLFLVMAERRGVSWDTLTGSVQNDFIMESVVRSAPSYLPHMATFRIQCDNIEFIRNNVPRWNCMTLNGYNLRDWGTSGITEMAVALANGMETLKELCNRGYTADYAAERLSFFWSVANDFFEEIARIRAVRRLWYKIMRYVFHAKNQKSMWMRCHVQTSGICLQREEPLNNIVRSAYHALAAVLGGAQSLHVDSYDEAYSVPSDDTLLLSLRTQEIIAAETQVTEVVDPVGGSFYLESLTNTIEDKILDEIDYIEKCGGLIHFASSGLLRQKVEEHINHEQEMIDNGTIKIVATQTMYAEIVKEIGRDKVDVKYVAQPKFNVHFIKRFLF